MDTFRPFFCICSSLLTLAFILQLSPDLSPPSSIPDEPLALALVPYVGEGTLSIVEVSAARDPVEADEVTSPLPTVPAPLTSVMTPIPTPVVIQVLS